MFNFPNLSNISIIVSLFFVITSFFFSAGLKELTNHITYIKIKNSKYISVIAAMYFILGAFLRYNIDNKNYSLIFPSIECAILIVIYYFFLKCKKDLSDKRCSKNLETPYKPWYILISKLLSPSILIFCGVFTPPVFLNYINDSNHILLILSIIIYFTIYSLSLLLAGIIYSISYIYSLKKYTIITSIDLDISFVNNKIITGYLICEENKGMIVKPLDHKPIYIKKDLIDVIIPIEDKLSIKHNH